jgi:hypothetical protein
MFLGAWSFGLLVLAATILVLLLLRHPRVHALFHEHVRDRPRRRLFLAAVGFFFTVGLARLAAFAASRNFGPFHYIVIRGTHVHHLVWGILILLVVGFCWLIEVGTGDRYSSLFTSRLMSLLYGIGAALTLDEFTFWLDLDPNAYWNREGRASFEVILLFGFALLLGIWGRNFWRALSREFLPRPRKSRSG